MVQGEGKGEEMKAIIGLTIIVVMVITVLTIEVCLGLHKETCLSNDLASTKATLHAHELSVVALESAWEQCGLALEKVLWDLDKCKKEKAVKE